MFTTRFWLLLVLFIGSYHQQDAAQALPPNARESSAESDGEEVPFLNEGEKLTDVAPDEQLKNSVEKRGSGIIHRPMNPKGNFLLEFPTHGKEQSDHDVNEKLMEAMVIMETDQLANENSQNNDFSSEKSQSVSLRSTYRPKTFPLENTSLGIVETRKSGNSAFQLHPSSQKGDNWAKLDEEDGAEDVGLGDTAVEEATDQFEAEGNNINRDGMEDGSQEPMEQMDSSFAPNSEGIYNFSKDAGIQSFANSESGNFSTNVRDPAMMTRNQRHYPNLLKDRNMSSAESDELYSEKRNASFKRSEGGQLKQERREITQNGVNWNLRAKENTLTAKGIVAIPSGNDESYYTQMKGNNELYRTDNESQGYVPLGDTAQENDETKDTRVENTEKRNSDDNNAPNVGFNDGMGPQNLANTSIGEIKHELQDNDEVERVFEDDANASETDDMNVGYDDFLLGRREFDSDRDKRIIHERDRFLRVPDLKHTDDEDRRSGNQKIHDSNEITAEGARRRIKGRKHKRPEGKYRMEEEDDNVQGGDDDEQCCHLMRKDKCKACSKQFKFRHGKAKGVSKSSDPEDSMGKDDDDVMDECSNTNHNHTHRPAPKE